MISDVVIFDSNIWIGYLDRDDSSHAKCVEIVSKNKEKVLVPEYVMLEVVTVLVRKRGKEIADKFIDFIINNQDTWLEPSTKDTFIKSLIFFQDNDYSSLSFVDQTLLFLSKDYKVITLDKNLSSVLVKNVKI